MRVLLVCANSDTTQLVLGALARDKLRVTAVESAREAWATLGISSFELLIFDNRLPDGNSIEVCRQARANGVRTPILLFSGTRSVDGHVQGLDAGADDSLAKPFAVAELRARVRALGRRSVESSIVQMAGEAELDFPKRRALVNGKEVQLTMKEWGILSVLAAAGGRVVPRARLTAEVWGVADASSSASLEVLMTRIRKKLGKAAVRTLRTEGYALGGPLTR